MNRVEISDLTPDETKRLDILLNREVSPCGNNLSLGQTLLQPGSCPLSDHAVEFVRDLIPFVLSMIVILFLIAYIPWLVTFIPEMALGR